MRSTRERSIETALQSLPVGLNATYERMLDRIDQHDRREAVAMLKWLSFAKHALTLGELQEARLINPELEGSVAWDDPGSIDDIVEILGDLIHVEGPFDVSAKRVRWKGAQERDWLAYDSYRDYVRAHGGNPSDGISSPGNFPAGERTDLYNAWWSEEGQKFARVQLAHFSVKEYLVSAHARQDLFEDLPFNEAAAQRYLAQSCLTYLLQYSKVNEECWCAQDNLKYPLLGYAARNWVSHVDAHDENALPHEIALLRDSKARSDWLNARYGICNTADEALHCASELGHMACVKALLDLGEPANSDSLMSAILGGHADLVTLLIKAGIDVNARAGNVSALGLAAANGHVLIVEALLGAGALTGFDDYLGHTALMIASAEGYIDVVQTLVDEAFGQPGAIPGFEQAIDLAAKEAHVDIEQMLLDQLMISQLQ